jgi:O-methyltransferase
MKVVTFFRVLMVRASSVLLGIQLKKYKQGITHKQVLPLATYSPWFDDDEFKAILKKIEGCTLVDKFRCFELFRLGVQLREKKGDVLEVGVWRGGTARILYDYLTGGDKLYLADTFTGVVKSSEMDTLYRGGEHADTSEEIVRSLFVGLDIDRFIFLKGIFPDKTGDMLLSRRLKFVHIDVDTHDSARDIFEFVWDRIIPGGVVVFDDYGFNGCEGVTQFFNDLSVSDGLKLHNLNGHGLLIKVPFNA